jgi:hypothetical protein
MTYKNKLMQISNNVKMPLWQRGALWVALLLLAGCQTELVNPFNASYVRVMDLRNFPAAKYINDDSPSPKVRFDWTDLIMATPILIK